MHKRLLQQILGMFVDIFLVISHDRFGDSFSESANVLRQHFASSPTLSGSVNLTCVATSGDPYADVDASKLVSAENLNTLGV